MIFVCLILSYDYSVSCVHCVWKANSRMVFLGIPKLERFRTVLRSCLLSVDVKKIWGCLQSLTGSNLTSFPIP